VADGEKEPEEEEVQVDGVDEAKEGGHEPGKKPGLDPKEMLVVR
jgi:hypothetical protein